jgi:hypothetical protein
VALGMAWGWVRERGPAGVRKRGPAGAVSSAVPCGHVEGGGPPRARGPRSWARGRLGSSRVCGKRAERRACGGPRPGHQETGARVAKDTGGLQQLSWAQQVRGKGNRRGGRQPHAWPGLHRHSALEHVCIRARVSPGCSRPSCSQPQQACRHCHTPQPALMRASGSWQACPPQQSGLFYCRCRLITPARWAVAPTLPAPAP